MENENTGQSESQPTRKKGRKAAAVESNEATETGQTEAPASTETEDAELAQSQETSQEPQPADEASPTLEATEEAISLQPAADAGQDSGDEVAQTEISESEEAGRAIAAESDDARPTEAGEPEDEPEEGETAEPDDRMPDGLPVRQVIEAVLFATDSPLPASKIAQILDRGTSRHVRRFIAELNEAYEREGRAFRIEEVAGGYQMLTVPTLQPWLAKLLRARQESRLSPTQMETLAVIAYKQPVLRAAVEVVRGVACGDVINRLREMGLVKIVGRAEDVGRPLLYGTTKKFLRVFGLGSLDDLPRVEELRPPEAAGAPQVAPEPAGPEPMEAAQEPPPAPAND